MPKKPSLGKRIADDIIGLTQEINPTGGMISKIKRIGNRYSLFFFKGLQIKIHKELVINAAENQIIIAI